MALTNTLLVYSYNNLILAVKIKSVLYENINKNIFFSKDYTLQSLALYNPLTPKYGNIYYGQILQFNKPLNSYIVNLGNNHLGLLKNNKQNLAFLKPLTLGKKFLCTIVKEGELNKSPIISPYLHFEGLYCNFNPYKTTILFNENTQNNLDFLATLQQQYSIPLGICIKTKSFPSDLIEEIKAKEILWKNILNSPNKKPGLIYAPNPILNLLYEDLNNIPSAIIINDLHLLENVKKEVHTLTPSLKIKFLYNKLNESFINIISTLETYLSNTITLPHDLTLNIYPTEALTFIDIDYKGKNNLTKEESLFKANLEAVPYIVNIIKLRNISGQIFIDALKIRNKKDILLNHYKNEFNKYSLEAKVLGYTKLGVIEVERRKKRSTIFYKFFSGCETCYQGQVLNNQIIHLKAILQIKHILESNPLSNIVIKSSTKILNTFKLENKDLLQQISKKYIVNENINNTIIIY